MKRTLLICLTIFTLSGCVIFMTRDQRYSKEIIGSWIVAGDSSDYRLVPMHERFFGDGTYWIFWFSDGTCTKIIGETHLSWKIENGVLISKITKVTSKAYGHVGDVMRSKIISLSKNQIVLYSLDDGTTYKRVRSTACLAPKQIKV